MSDSKSTKNLAIRGVLFNWFGRVSSFLISFVLTPILVRGLGNESYGIWSILMTLTTYYALADLGLRGAGVKFISQYAATKDWENVNKVLVTCLGLFLVLAACLVPVVLLVAWSIPAHLNTEHVGLAVIRLVIVLTGATVVLGIPGQVFAAVLAATKRFDLSNALGVTIQLTQSTILIIVVWRGGGIVEMAQVTLLVAILAQVSRIVLAKVALPQARFSIQFLDREMAGRLIRFGSLNVVQGIGRLISKSAGTVLVGFILGPVQVTYFSIAESLTKKSTELSRSICSVLMPVASQFEAQERHEDLERMLLVGTSVLAALGAGLAIVFVVLGDALISSWIGAEYVKSTYPILSVLSISLVITTASNGLRSILRGTNRMRLLAGMGICEALVTLVLGVGMLELFGLEGMPYAILITQLMISGIVLPYATCKAIDLPINKYLNRGVFPGLLAAVPMLLFLVGSTVCIPPTNLILLVIHAGIALIVLGFGVLFICFEADTRSAILSSVSIPFLGANRR